MDTIEYKVLYWWHPSHDKTLLGMYLYSLENDKELTGVQVSRVKSYIIADHAGTTTPDFKIFWDDDFQFKFLAVEANKVVFRSFDVGFLRARIIRAGLAEGRKFSPSPFQNDFTDFPNAMCPDCMHQGREYRILTDNVFHNARCAACGVTDYIYTFDKEMSNEFRADAEKKLVNIFKAAENSRETPQDRLEPEIKDRMEELREETGLKLCGAYTVLSGQEKEALERPEVQSMLPARQRRYP